MTQIVIMIKCLVFSLLISSVQLIDPISTVESSIIIQSINSHSEEFNQIFKSVKTISILLTSNDTRIFENIFNLFKKSFIVYNFLLPDKITQDFQCHDYNRIKQEEDSRKKRSIYVPLDLIKIQNQWKQSSKAGYIIETNWNNLRILMDCLINSLGIFIFIVNDKNNENYRKNISQNFRNAWRNIGAYDIYILIENQIIAYDPFLSNNRKSFHGSIISYADKKIDLFKDLNMYPLRMEIIQSTYSVLKLNKSDSKLINYEGADIEIVNVLKRSMNFIGKSESITPSISWSK